MVLGGCFIGIVFLLVAVAILRQKVQAGIKNEEIQKQRQEIISLKKENLLLQSRVALLGSSLGTYKTSIKVSTEVAAFLFKCFHGLNCVTLEVEGVYYIAYLNKGLLVISEKKTEFTEAEKAFYGANTPYNRIHIS